MQRKDPRSGRYPCKAKGRTREAGGTLGKSKKAPAREQLGAARWKELDCEAKGRK